MLVQVVQNDIGEFTASQLDDDSHAVFVGLVAKFADTLQTFLANEIGDFLDQPGFIHLVGQFGNDDPVAPPRVEWLDTGACADIDTATTGSVGRINALRAVDDSRCREVRTGNMFHETGNIDRWIVDQSEAGVDDFGQVMRGNIRRHTDSDARRPVDQKIGYPRRHDCRFGLGAVVILDKIDRFSVDVGQDLVRDARHPDFRVSHCRRRIAIDGAEVSLAIHQ